jgi:hypothetical protein
MLNVILCFIGDTQVCVFEYVRDTSSFISEECEGDPFFYCTLSCVLYVLFLVISQQFARALNCYVRYFVLL